MYLENQDTSILELVTAPGFKPGTSTAVMWCSIQLSHAAKIHSTKLLIQILLKSDRARIQTWNLHSRNVVLYSVEPRGQISNYHLKLSRKVTAPGFKPGTSTAVMWCSIQLSHAAFSY